MVFLFESGGFHFYRCPRCSYAKRAEPAAVSEHLYHADEYLGQFADESEHRRKKASVVERIGRYAPPPGRLLDLGCSVGILLDEAKKAGWEPYGVELSAGAVARAKARGLAEIRQSTVEDARYPDGFFKAVVMSHILEHLDDPFTVLRRISGWIEPGGVLCVGLPNFASHSAKRDGPSWSTLEAQEHISQFTPAALRRALETYAGMRVVCATGDHRFGEVPRGVGGHINYFIDYLKDRLMFSRSMVLIARKNQ